MPRPRSAVSPVGHRRHHRGLLFTTPLRSIAAGQRGVLVGDFDAEQSSPQPIADVDGPEGEDRQPLLHRPRRRIIGRQPQHQRAAAPHEALGLGEQIGVQPLMHVDDDGVVGASQPLSDGAGCDGVVVGPATTYPENVLSGQRTDQPLRARRGDGRLAAEHQEPTGPHVPSLGLQSQAGQHLHPIAALS